MNSTNDSRRPAGEQMRQGHRLIQVGVSLFLIALLTGLVVHRMPLPRLALSAHLLGIMQGTFLAYSRPTLAEATAGKDLFQDHVSADRMWLPCSVAC